jgi:hypothetical protein
MVTRTRLSVTLYVQCVSCYISVPFFLWLCSSLLSFPVCINDSVSHWHWRARQDVRKRSWPKLRYCPVIFVEGLRKNHETPPLRVVSIPAEISTCDLPNASFLYSQLARFFVFLNHSGNYTYQLLRIPKNSAFGPPILFICFAMTQTVIL